MTKRSLKTLTVPMITENRSATTMQLYVSSPISHETPGLGTQRTALPIIVARHCEVMIARAMATIILAILFTMNNSRYKRRTDNFARNIDGP